MKHVSFVSCAFIGVVFAMFSSVSAAPLLAFCSCDSTAKVADPNLHEDLKVLVSCWILLGDSLSDWQNKIDWSAMRVSTEGRFISSRF